VQLIRSLLFGLKVPHLVPVEVAAPEPITSIFPA